MMKLKQNSSNIINILKKININFIIYIILSNLISIHISMEFGNADNIIIFNHSKFKAGNFATNKNGELFIEYYSEDDKDTPASRLFYGLQKNGRELFLNESSSTQEINIGLDETIDIFGYNYFNIYDSKNLFVTIKNELNKKNQYLLSINSYDSMVELHKFNNNINTAHYLWNFYDFFNLNIKQYIFPYETFLFELKEESSYIIAFIPKMYVNEDMKELSFIKKFRFKTFNEDAYDEITTIDYNNHLNNRILSSFLMDDKYLVVISLEKIVNEENDEFWSLKFRFNLSLYFNIFDSFKYGFNELFYLDTFHCRSVDEIFFKAYYLKKGFTLFAFIEGEDYLFIYLYKISYSKGALQYIDMLYDYIRVDYEILFDFIKINENKLAFITNLILDAWSFDRRNLENMGSLYILIIDIQSGYFPNFREKKTYNIEIENYMPKFQISGFIYNNFLLFTSTAIPIEEYYNFNDDNYLSMFMIFGYPNGTDIIVDDISFLFYSDDDSPIVDFPFYDFLLDGLTIENNIFNYIQADIIKLVSLPDELILYEINQNENSIIRKQNNSEIYKSLSYKFEQNLDLIKTSKYYYIDYQYIVQEELNPEEINQEKPKLYYGRINRLKFKLCHEYCETCYEFNMDDEVQNCESCLPEYQYDYFFFSNRAEENPNNLCVPEGYYYDTDNNELIKCNKYNKYYVNTTDNKRICFQNEDNYPCPSSYPVLDKITNKCYNKSEFYLDEMIKNFQEYISNEINIEYIDNGEDYIVSTEEMTYSLTTTKNQKRQINDNTTIIDLGECENKLKNEYNIPKQDSLYILKINILVDNIQKIEYEVYYKFSENNFTKLNLTVCKDIKIDILIPINISSNEIDKYNKNSGYYNDICYSFTTDSGTDISLFDRRNDYKENKLHICEDGCDYTGYNENSKKVKCSCFTKLTLPLFSDIKVDKKQLLSNFKDIRNIGNFKMLKCIKLFFNKNNIFKNLSNYIFVILFILSIISVFIFAFYDYKKMYRYIYSYSNEEKIDNKIFSENNMATDNNKNINDDKNSELNKNKIIKKNNKIIKKIIVIRNKKRINSAKIYNSIKNKSSLVDIKLKSSEYNHYDYKLNELEYEEALKKDKRTFFQLFLSLIKIKHRLIFTFIHFRDYNSQIIKILIFFFTFAINLTVSAMFYSDTTMHKIYVDDGAFDFTYQLPQMVYSLIISLIIEVILNQLGLYEQDIIEFKKGNKNKGKVISNIKCKIIIFFVIAYILLFFSWVYLGCFCAVYKNTQIHLFKDVVSSFSFSFITPFFIVLLQCIFRILSLKDKKDKKPILFKISRILQNL